MRLAVVAHRPTETNVSLTAAAALYCDSALLSPAQALVHLQPGDVAVARLDVLPTLDGVEPGIWALEQAAARGVRVLNGPATLLAAHDKLLTAKMLARACLPHPRTVYVESPADPVELEPPVVVKPRFGSWGLDVHLCVDWRELEECLAALADRPWFQSTGVLVQELVPPLGYDLRLIVANGAVVGSIQRVAAAGEWRTNVALGGVRRPVTPPASACSLALAAAEAIGGDLVGVDLLPYRPGGYVVLEVNGAVDFTTAYSLEDDVFAAAVAALVSEPTAEFEDDAAAAGLS
jgi:ribosomal protein S6--L-glutamate ligase